MIMGMISQPNNYLMCQNAHCSCAKNCLHYIAYENLDDTTDSLDMLNPKKFNKSEKCMYFKPSEKVKVAWGLTKLLSMLPYESAKAIRKALISRFSKTRYYRYYRSELPIYPAAQKVIETVFQKYNITTPPVYDRFSEEYEW